jgi:hypothetical protein
MSKVIADISMSLDGYVTGRGVDQEHGLGISTSSARRGWFSGRSPESPRAAHLTYEVVRD